MLAQERFQIFPIYVAIFPIINRIKRLLNIETLRRIHLLFKLLCHPVQGNLPTYKIKTKKVS